MLLSLVGELFFFLTYTDDDSDVLMLDDDDLCDSASSHELYALFS
jgi:hypothetical protein